MKNKILAGPDPADPDLNASRNYVDVTILVDSREYAHGMLMGKKWDTALPSGVIKSGALENPPFISFRISIYLHIYMYIYI